MRQLLAALVIVFVPGLLSAQREPSLPTLYRPQLFDVLHYEAQITLADLPSKSINGMVDIILQWSETGPTTFPYYLRSLVTDSAVVSGKRVEVTDIGVPANADYRHTVPIGQRNGGDLDTIRVYYHGNMTVELGGSWGGVQYQDSVLYAMGVGFHNNYVSATQHWMPCYDHPGDKATFRCTFTTPESVRVASNGLVELDTVIAGPKKNVRITRWNETHECATYLMTFVAGPLIRLDIASDPVPVVAYSLARDTAATRRSMMLVADMVRMYESRLTRYPFSKVGYANTTQGSMEHQTMVCIALSISQSADTVNTTAAHELAHQWFGDAVTPLDFRDAWLTESFATFCESWWTEHLFGTTKYLTYVGNAAKDYMFRIAKTSGIGQHEGVFPLYDFPRSTTSNYPETIYKKGAVVLSMLRAMMSDDAFFLTLRMYLENNTTRNASTEEFIQSTTWYQAFNSRQFFTEWVYGKGWAKLRVEFTPVGQTMHVRITQVQHDLDTSWTSYTNLPLNCTFTDVSGRQRDTLFIMSGTTPLEFDVATAASLKINNGTKCRSLVEVVQTTSVDALHTASSVSIGLAPNPAMDSFTLTRASGDEPCTVDVIDQLGASCYATTWPAGSTALLIPAASCANGSYQVVVRSASSQHSIPLIITPSW